MQSASKVRSSLVVDIGQSLNPACLLLGYKLRDLSARLARHGHLEPLDVVLEARCAANDLDFLDAPDALKHAQVAVSNAEEHGLHDVDGELVKPAVGLGHGVGVVWEIDIQTHLSVEAADAGDEGRLFDRAVPISEAGE